MNDLINRQDAIDAMNEVYCHIEMIKKRPVTKTEQAMYLDMRGAVESVPSAEPKPITVNIDHELTPCEYEKLRKDMANAPIMLLPTATERKRGEWIDHDLYFACNQCGQLFTIDSNFCPNCGARMVNE